MMVVLSQRKISFCFLLATVVGAVVAAGKTWAVTDSLGTFKLMETALGSSLTLSCLAAVI